MVYWARVAAVGCCAERFCGGSRFRVVGVYHMLGVGFGFFGVLVLGGMSHKACFVDFLLDRWWGRSGLLV